MWELARLPRGGFIPRRFVVYILAVIIAAFLWVIFASHNVLAADADWNGNDILYHVMNDDRYKPETATATTLSPEIPNGNTYYSHEVSGAADPTWRYIYFQPGSATSTATSATLVTVAYKNDPNRTKAPTDRRNVQQITINPKGSVTSSDATWKDASTLIYADGNGGAQNYEGTGSGPRIANGTSPAGMPNGAQYYQWQSPGSGKMHYIYFDASDNVTTATTAHYINADGSQTPITVIPQVSPTGGPTSGPGSTTAGTSTTTCSIEKIGWIVCPVSEFIADRMDNLFDFLAGFLKVDLMTTKNNNVLYNAWAEVRTIADVVFVIAFLIVIYSQVTNLGISNYGLKKLLPRMIIAALLINVSYWLCAILIDLSNILGVATNQFFITLQSTIGSVNNNDVTSWSSVTGFVLTTTTATVAAGVGAAVAISATGGSIAAAGILLLPVLLTVLTAVLVALVVLAVRQALIALLIIVAPLALVAYILPNTEEWFTRWRKLFTTMLVLFPLVALVFGGAQLAGALIRGTSNDIMVILLSMFVQVAPIVVTPLLVKLSGNLVARIANLVNNPNKGLIDRTRNWAKDRADLYAKRNLARQDPVRPHQFVRRMALGLDQGHRVREGRKALYTELADGRWTNSQDYSDIQFATQRAKEIKAAGETAAELRYAVAKNVNVELRGLDVHVRDLKLQAENAKQESDLHWEHNHTQVIREHKLEERVLKDRLSNAKADEDARFEEFRAGNAATYAMTGNVARMLRQSQHDTEEIAVHAMASQAAKYEQLRTRATLMSTENPATLTPVQNARRVQLLDMAGGIQGVAGQNRAIANSLAELGKLQTESISNAETILAARNLTAAQTLQLAQNISVAGITVTEDVQRAAAKRVASGGVMPHIETLLKSVDMTANGDNTTRHIIVDALRANSNRQKFLGFGLLDKMYAGLPTAVTDASVDEWVQDMLVAGKLSANEMATQDVDTLMRVADALTRLPRTPQMEEARDKLRQEIYDLKHNAQIWNRAGERKAGVEAMERNL